MSHDEVADRGVARAEKMWYRPAIHRVRHS